MIPHPTLLGTHMKPNVGNIDRLLRALAGVILIMLSATGTIGTWGWIVGLILLATAVLRFCGLYPLLGINTCPRDSSGK